MPACDTPCLRPAVPHGATQQRRLRRCDLGRSACQQQGTTLRLPEAPSHSLANERTLDVPACSRSTVAVALPPFFSFPNPFACDAHFCTAITTCETAPHAQLPQKERYEPRGAASTSPLQLQPRGGGRTPLQAGFEGRQCAACSQHHSQVLLQLALLLTHHGQFLVALQ